MKAEITYVRLFDDNPLEAPGITARVTGRYESDIDENLVAYSQGKDHDRLVLACVDGACATKLHLETVKLLRQGRICHKLDDDDVYAMLHALLVTRLPVFHIPG